MKIILTILAKNEVDILREFLDFHLACGVDFIVAMDNNSDDGTTEIFHEYKKSGVLHLLHEPSDLYKQAEWSTRMSTIARDDFGADWILCGDADEFWHAGEESLSGSLRDTLGSVPASADGLTVDRLQFSSPPIDTPETTPWWQSMDRRHRTSETTFGGRLPPKVCVRGRTPIAMMPGNHSATFSDGSPMNFHPAPDHLRICHYPIRSYSQLVSKMARIEIAYASKPPTGSNPGPVQRRIFEEWKAGRLPEFYESFAYSPESPHQDGSGRELTEDHRILDTLGRIAS